MFSPKCSFAIRGRKILIKSTYMQENHFPSQLVIYHLPDIRRSPHSAAEHFRKTRIVKPAMCCGHRQNFSPPFGLYLNFWTFFTYHKDVYTSQGANFVIFPLPSLKTNRHCSFSKKKENYTLLLRNLQGQSYKILDEELKQKYLNFK